MPSHRSGKGAIMRGLSVLLATLPLLCTCAFMPRSEVVETNSTPKELAIAICADAALETFARYREKKPPYTTSEINHYMERALRPKLTYLEDQARPIVEKSIALAERYVRSSQSDEDLQYYLKKVSYDCLIQLQKVIEETPAPLAI